MSEAELIDSVLVALRDVGLSGPEPTSLDARCRTALQREIEREDRRRRDLLRPHPRARRRGPRRRAVVVAVSLAAMLLLAAVGYATLSSPEQLSAGVECHRDASLTGSGTITPLDGRAATEICARLWAQGAVSEAHAPPAPLHACVDPSGGNAIHVLPSSQSNVCARVGLREDPAAGANPTGKAYAGFQSELLGQLGREQCPTDAAVRSAVAHALASTGLTGWTVTSDAPLTSGQPCASVALNSDTRTVTIVPIAR